jgi:hypothetical protein
LPASGSPESAAAIGFVIRTERAEHQDALVVRGDPVEHLAGEVAEHRFGRREPPAVERGVAAGRVLAHEDETRRPAVRALVHAVEEARLDRAARCEQPRRLVAGEAQLLGGDPHDRLSGHEPREFVRRLGAAGDDHVHPDRDLLQGRGECRAALAAPPGLVNVVEHEHATGRHAGEELAEPPAREAHQVAAVLVGEERERRELPAEARAGEAEVVEEGRRVLVTGVGVVPDRRGLARLEVARDERALAGPRTTQHPDHRMLAPLVEQAKQPLPRAHAVQARRRELGELRGGRRHPFARERPLV